LEQILNAKTIIPLLEKNIHSNSEYIQSWEQWDINTSNSNASGIKTLSVLENVSLVNLEGRGFTRKTGVDARIFRVMGDNGISVVASYQDLQKRNWTCGCCW
jgi:aspartokinase